MCAKRMTPMSGRYSPVAILTARFRPRGEHIAQQNTKRRPSNRKHPGKPTTEAMGRKLLDIIVYSKSCRSGHKLVLDDLAETTEIGDWKMPDFKSACTFAASQGWLVIEKGWADADLHEWGWQRPDCRKHNDGLAQAAVERASWRSNDVGSSLPCQRSRRSCWGRLAHLGEGPSALSFT